MDDDWGAWIQRVGESVINKAADAKYNQPYQIESLKLKALGDAGYYQEGQAGVAAHNNAVPPGLLLLAVIGLAIFVMKY